MSREGSLKRLADLVVNLLNSKYGLKIDMILSEDTDYRPIYLILQTMQHFYTHEIS